MTSPQAEVEAPGGWKLKLNGASTPAILVSALFCCAMMWLWRTGDVKADERNQAIIAAQKKVEDALTSYDRTNRILIYVISLSPSDREKLQLLRPPGLTELQR